MLGIGWTILLSWKTPSIAKLDKIQPDSNPITQIKSIINVNNKFAWISSINDSIKMLHQRNQLKDANSLKIVENFVENCKRLNWFIGCKSVPMLPNHVSNIVDRIIDSIKANCRYNTQFTVEHGQHYR